MVHLPDFDFEKSLLPPNTRYLLGIDNFDPQIFINLKVRDSKLLSEKQRKVIVSEFNRFGFIYSTSSISSVDIGQQGISNSIKRLIVKTQRHFQSKFNFCIVDGNYNLGLPNTVSVVKADQKCFSVAAASIAAKVDRDTTMEMFHLKFPQYGFDRHKGYGTRRHSLALQTHGPCPIHWKSFRPISTFLQNP